MWHVYFLQLSNDDIYVGSTNDLKRRFSAHRAGYVLSTKGHLPAVLKSYVAAETEDHARDLRPTSNPGQEKQSLSNASFAKATLLNHHDPRRRR